MTRKKRRFTKRPMVHSSFRLAERDRERLIQAAEKLEISANQFVRAAVQEKTNQVLDGHEQRSSL